MDEGVSSKNVTFLREEELEVERTGKVAEFESRLTRVLSSVNFLKLNKSRSIVALTSSLHSKLSAIVNILDCERC